VFFIEWLKKEASKACFYDNRLGFVIQSSRESSWSEVASSSEEHSTEEGISSSEARISLRLVINPSSANAATASSRAFSKMIESFANGGTPFFVSVVHLGGVGC